MSSTVHHRRWYRAGIIASVADSPVGHAFEPHGAGIVTAASCTKDESTAAHRGRAWHLHLWCGRHSWRRTPKACQDAVPVVSAFPDEEGNKSNGGVVHDGYKKKWLGAPKRNMTWFALQALMVLQLSSLLLGDLATAAWSQADKVEPVSNFGLVWFDLICLWINSVWLERENDRMVWFGLRKLH